jgi:LPXTG-motif cell wall-anchored protein
LIVGLLALAVSVWAFIGPTSMPSTGVIPLGWIVVIAAILIGIVLVVSPRKSR